VKVRGFFRKRSRPPKMLPLALVASLSWQAGLAPARTSAFSARCALPHRMCDVEPASTPDASTPDEPGPPPAAVNAPAPRFDLEGRAKENAKVGAGFNQFDPVLSATNFISRRFGLAGGLAVVGLLAATEGNEILKSITDTGPQPGSGEVITTASGLQYADILVASRGDAPLPGAVIGFNAKVTVGERVLFDSTAGPDAKPIAFKYGQRPFQNVVCEGVEEGLKGMKPGSKRRLIVPSNLAPKGVEIPDGVKLGYEIELLEVLPSYF
jgi:hypothetical protein